MYNILYANKKELKKRLRNTKPQLLKKLARKIADSFKKLIINFNELLNRKYYALYTNREKITKVIVRSICLLSLIFIITGIILDIFKHGNPILYFIPLIMWIIYILFYLYLKYYYIFFGGERVLRYEYQKTVEYITTKLPKINKVYGKTGAGKDTFSVASSVIIADSMRNKILNELEDLKRILYIFDFDLVDKFSNENYLSFGSFSYEKSKIALLNALERYKGFIKVKYRPYIKYKQLIELWSLQEQYPNENFTKFSYTDGIRYFAFYQLLLEYILKYIRVYIEQNFIMANQPLMEAPGLMAKIFSLNFMQVKQMEYTEDKQKYESLMLFPWKDNIIVLETEAGSWYFNRDKQNSKAIYSSGVRDFKAYNRHFLENMYWFTNDQDSSRVDKLLRELDHSYIQILRKEIIQGGIKRRVFYNWCLKSVNKKIVKFEYKKERRSTKLHIYKERFKVYDIDNKEKLFVKYKNKYNKLKKKQINDKKLDLALAKRKELVEKIAQASNDGYIKMLINVSDQPMAVNLEKLSLQNVVDNKELLYHSSYQIELTFKIKDAHGRYDTHYMKAVAERIAQISNYDFIDVPRWNPDLKIKKDDVLYMGYPASFNMFGITDEEYKTFRYTKKK